MASLEENYLPKAEQLAQAKEKKINDLSLKVTGSYDADSYTLEQGGTGRLDSGKGYYVQAPELYYKKPKSRVEEFLGGADASKEGQLNPYGVQARVVGDQYDTGVQVTPDTVTSEQYEAYKSIANPLVAKAQQQDQLQVIPTGEQDLYGRPLYTSQRKDQPLDKTDFLIEQGQGVGIIKDPMKYLGSFATQTPEEYRKEQVRDQSSLANAAKGFAYTLGEGVVNTLDLVPEVAEYVAGNIQGGKKWSNTEGLYGSEESEAFKNWIDYNDKVINQLGEDAVVATKNAWETGDYWGLVTTLGRAAVTPELYTVSLGYVGGMIIPGLGATKLLETTSKVGKTAKALQAKGLSPVEALAKAEKDAGIGYSIAKTMAGNVGFVAEAEQFGREAEDLYAQTYGVEMPIEQRLLTRPLGLLYAKLDAITAKAILLGKDPIAKAIPDMVKQLPEAMKVSFAGKVATLTGVTATRAAGAFAVEGGTEAVQTAMEQVAGRYKEGEKGVGDVLSEQAYDIAGAGLLGGVGGVQMAAPSIAAPGIAEVGSAVKDKLQIQPTELEQEITATEQTTTSNEQQLKEDAIKAFDEGDITTASIKIRDAVLSYKDLDEETKSAKLEELSPLIDKLRQARSEEASAITKTKEVPVDILRSTPESENRIAELIMEADAKDVDELVSVLRDNPSLVEAYGPEILNAKLEQAKEDRVFIDTLKKAGEDIQQSIGSVRQEVLSKGYNKDLLGAIEWYKMSKNSDKDIAEFGKENLARFGRLEQDKQSKLETGRKEAVAEITADLESKRAAVNEKATNEADKLSIDEMVKAQLFIEGHKRNREGRLVRGSVLKNADNTLVKETKDAYMKLAKLEGFASNADKIDNYRLKGKFDVVYSDSDVGRNQGVFEINKYDALLDVVQDKLADSYSKLDKESAVTRLIGAIGRETTVIEGLIKRTERQVEEQPTIKKEDKQPDTQPTDKDVVELKQEVEEETSKRITWNDIEEAFTADNEDKSFRKYAVDYLEKLDQEGTDLSLDASDYKSTKDYVRAMQLISSTLGRRSELGNQAKEALDAFEQTAASTVKETKTQLKQAEETLSKVKRLANKVLGKQSVYVKDIANRKSVIEKMELDRTALQKEKDLLVQEIDKAYESVSKQKEYIKKYVDKASTGIDPTRLIAGLESIDRYLDLIHKKIVTQIKRFLTRLRNLTSKITGLEDELDKVENRLVELDEAITVKSLEVVSLEKKAEKVLKTKVKKQEKVVEALKDVVKGTIYSQRLIAENAFSATTPDQKLPTLDKEGNRISVPVATNKLLDTVKEPISELANFEISKDTNPKVVRRLRDVYKTLKTIVPMSLGSKGEYTGLTTDTGRGLLLNKEGTEYNVNVVAAMLAAVSEEVAKAGSKYSNMTHDEAARYFGIEENEDVPDGLLQLGVPKKYVAKTLGKSVLNNLGLKMAKSDNADVEFMYEKLEMSIGQSAMYLAEKLGYWNVETISNNDLNEMLNKAAQSTEATTDFVKIHDKAKMQQARDDYNLLNSDLVIPSNTKQVRYDYKDMRKTDPSIRRNDFTEAPEATKEAIKYFTNMQFSLNTEAVKYLIELDRDTLKVLLGYKADYSNLHKAAQKATESKNNEVDRNIEALEDAYNKVSSGEETNTLYFDWFISRNGRMMIDSAGLNPQSKKLHRFLVNTEEQEWEVTKENEHVFKLAIAQAFGFAIDKKSQADSIKFADMVLNEKGLEAKVKEALSKGHNEVILSTGETIEIEELGHAIVGVVEVSKWQKRKKDESFITKLTVEADGVTNGFALKLLQIPLLADSKGWLQKAGVFVDGKPEQWRGQGTPEIRTQIEDSYQTLAKKIGTDEDLIGALRDSYVSQETIDEYKAKGKEVRLSPVQEIFTVPEKAIVAFTELRKGMEDVISDDKVTKFGRDVFKNPFMTFNYGAGFTAIKRGLTNKLQDGLLQKMVDGELNGFMKLMQLTPELLKEKIPKEIKIKGANGKVHSLHDVMNALVGESYGNRVKEVLSEEFAAIIDANKAINTGFATMYSVFDKMYRKDVADNYNGRATKKQQKEVFEKYKDLFPIIKAPLGDGKSDGIAIYKTELVGANKSPLGTIGTFIVDDGKVVQRSVQSIERDIAEAGVAGSVIPIHYLDGSIMTPTAMNSGALEIHDALMLGGNAEAVVSKYNENMYKLSKDWSLVEELDKSLTKALKKVGILDNNEAASNSSAEKTNEYKAWLHLRSVSEAVKTARDEMFSKSMTIDHMAFTSNTEYVVKTGNVVSSKSGIFATKEKSKVESKAETNQLDGKIDGRKAVADDMTSKLVTLMAGKKIKPIQAVIDKIKDC